MTVHERRFTAALPMETRLAAIQTANAETRTVEVVWTTGAKVRRTRYEGWDRTIPYDETLLVSAAAIDLTRLQRGAPVLDSHRTWSGTAGQVAVVERAWLDGARGLAVLRFPEAGTDEEADKLFEKVRQGIVRNVSVGYTRDRVRIVPPEKRDDVEQMIVERWTPYEVSFVTMPADPGAQVREAATTHPCEFVEERAAPAEQETTMSDDTRAAQAASPQAAPDAAAILAAERARAGEITALGTRHGMSADHIRAAVDAGTTVEAYGRQVLDQLAARQERSETHVEVSPGPSGDDPAVRREAMTEALVARVGERSGRRVEPSAAARPYMRHGFADFAAEMLGVRNAYRMTPAEREKLIHRAYHTTSDFPGLLADASNKILLARYQTAAPRYRRIATRIDMSDFKPTNVLREGDFPALAPIPESGEIKVGTLGESREVIRLVSYGRQIRITRQALVNDDLGAFDRVFASTGQRVADFENATFFALKATSSGIGPALATDNKAVYHADHGNLAASGAAISVDTLGAARAAMAKQKSIDGMALNIEPTMIVTSPDRLTAAQQIVAAIQPQQAGNVNPFSGLLEPIADANLTGNAWYLYADPAIAPVWAYGYLGGAAGPEVRTDEPFGVDGVALQLIHDFGVAAIDFRGGFRNPGA